MSQIKRLTDKEEWLMAKAYEAGFWRGVMDTDPDAKINGVPPLDDWLFEPVNDSGGIAGDLVAFEAMKRFPAREGE